MYRQAKWSEPVIFELGQRGAVGFIPPELEKEIDTELEQAYQEIPTHMRRRELNLPELTEPEVIRHFTRLSQMNYSISTGTYPLGSCTMKYNPVLDEELARLNSAANVHPLQDAATVQGSLELLHRLEKILCEITGMQKFSFMPSAGAHGEFLACLMMRAYHKQLGRDRTEIVVPDSAHGTNPASAAMSGFKVRVVKSNSFGCVDIGELERTVSDRTAGLMLTNPNTLGVFEREIEKIVKIVHGVDGLLYYDGANLNAILGKVRPGDMGFDIVHLNIHKTFSTPHGGGGPGAGPIGVVQKLNEFLPAPTVEHDEEKKQYYLNYRRPKAVGRIRSFHGNFAVYLRAYAYILRIGAGGLGKIAEASVVGSNYLLHKIRKLRGVSIPYNDETPRKHEFVVSLAKLAKSTGVSAMDVAKRMLDYGVHSPTVYFPLIVEEGMMVEPTETESKRSLDQFADSLAKVIEEAYSNPAIVKTAPHNTSVNRIDEARASHPKFLTPSWKVYARREKLGTSNGS